jgi:hypothetical protein
MAQYFRGVVKGNQPDSDLEGKPIYKYVIIGMLVTDEDIPELDKSQAMLDGPACDLGIALSAIHQRPELEPEYCKKAQDNRCSKILNGLTDWDFFETTYKHEVVTQTGKDF